MAFDWRTRLRIWTAKWLIRWGKLTHSDYTVDELNDLLAPHLPLNFDVDVPTGSGTLTLLEGQLSLPTDANRVDVQLLCAFDVNGKNSPLYRAHLIVTLQAIPDYDPETACVRICQLDVGEVRLVNDEYAFLNDSKDILNRLVPKPMQNLFMGTVLSTVGFMTAGGSDTLLNYLRLYLSGSKQRVLDYHRPQLTDLIQNLTRTDMLSYEMDDQDWQEYLFRRHGRQVLVEDGVLRFRF